MAAVVRASAADAVVLVLIADRQQELQALDLDYPDCEVIAIDGLTSLDDLIRTSHGNGC